MSDHDGTVHLDMRYGKWTVLEDAGKTRAGHRLVLAKCECGTEKTVLLSHLKCGRSTQCQSCHSLENRVRLAEYNRSAAGRAQAAERGRSTENCVRLLGTVTKHGLSRHPLYQTWCNMMHRCYDPRDVKYPRYGGRGITVSPAWHEVRTFIEWIEFNLGPRPEGCYPSGRPLYSLDRYPDNDGNYEPGNVRWADMSEQNRARG